MKGSIRIATRLIQTYGAALCAAIVPLVASGEPANAVRADAVVCVSCHGMQGEGALAGAPRLAGQNADYMAHALSMFKAGTRKSAVMQPVAATLSDAGMQSLALYFSQQRAPVSTAAVVSPSLLHTGKALAEVGAPNAAACFTCHGPQGHGNGVRYPSIAGQPTQFVIDRLHEFQARAKSAAPQPGTMTAVAATLTEAQIQAAAIYLSQLN
jgi:cytochrome c553